MNVSSQLDSVTVYSRGALCTRKAKVAAAGARQLRVTGLPLTIQLASLRARVLPGSGTAPRVLDVRPGYEVELAAEADVPTEQKSLEAASATVSRLQHDLQRLEREIQELQKLKPVFPAMKPGEPPRSAPVEALLKAAEFVSQELEKRFAVRRTLTQELDDARNELELRRRRLAEASASVRTERARLSRVAVVTLSEGAADVELAIEYFVPGARWAPSYALRLDKNMAAGALTMRAAVAQNTGEDWSQVKLSLSTAALDRRTALPELKSLRIGREQRKPPRSGWREAPPGLDELFTGFDSGWAGKPQAPPPPMQRPPAPVAAAPVSKSRRSPTGEVPLAGAGMPPAPPPPRSAPPSMMMEQQAGPERLRRDAPRASRASMVTRSAKKGGFLPSFGGGGSSRDIEYDDEPEAEESGYFEEEQAADLANLLDARAESPPEPQLELGTDLLDYGGLFMAPPGTGRGRLAKGLDTSLVYLQAMHVEVTVVTALVMSVARRAMQVEQLQLPPRAVEPSGGSFDYRYDCAARVDVPSKGEWTIVPVADADVGLFMEHSCVPSVEPQVYRTLKLHNRSKHALLSGPVDVTLGDEFLLTADLPLIAPGAKDARLGLGVEEAIKIARKTNFKETTGGLLGGSTVLPHDVEIEVNNRLQVPATVEVRERVPVSEDDDVKVEEAKVDPPWEKDEALRDGAVVRGARAWRVTVAAGQKVTLTAQWVVRIPSDKMVVGGNRRT